MKRSQRVLVALFLALGAVRLAEASRLHLHNPSIRRLEGEDGSQSCRAPLERRRGCHSSRYPHKPPLHPLHARRQGHTAHTRQAGDEEAPEVRPGGAVLWREASRRRRPPLRDAAAPAASDPTPSGPPRRRFLNVQTDLGEQILILGDAAQAAGKHEALFAGGARVSLQGVFISRGAGAVRVVSGHPVAKAQYCFAGNNISIAAPSRSAARAAAAQTVTCERVGRVGAIGMGHMLAAAVCLLAAAPR